MGLAIVLCGLSSCDLLLQNLDEPRVNPSPQPSPQPVVRPSFKAGRFSQTEELPTRRLGNLLVEHDYYAASYVARQKNPEWIAYEVQADLLNLDDKAERNHSFTQDPKNPFAPRTAEYNNSGYDRGHLAPAEDLSFDAEAMRQSFYMTNVSPQEPRFNRGLWKALENRVRRWAGRDRRLYVVTGPILPKRVTATMPRISDSLIVPTAFYKVILDYDLPVRKGIAFIMENKEGNSAELMSYAVPISEVEKRTDINFFPKLTEAERLELETKFDPKLWEAE